MGRGLAGIDVSKPLQGAQAKRLIKEILGTTKRVAWKKHVLDRMKERDLIKTDVINVLKNGRISEDQPEPDLKTGEWKYRVETERMAVVIVFRSIDELAVITAFRTVKRGR